MRVFDISKTNELTEYDLTKGYLKSDVISKTIPEQQEQEEVSHYETIAEYPNGGKSVQKVIDKEYIPYMPEREEVEEIQVFVEYTAKQIEQLQNQKEIEELEKWFVTYDRVCIEHARCQRMGVECHHNIDEWDIQAVQKAKKLNRLRTLV